MDKRRFTPEKGKDHPGSIWATVAQSLGVKKSWVWLLIVSILLSLAVPFILGGFSQFKQLKKLPWWAALILTLLTLISWVFNALRTRMLMGAMDEKINFRKAMLTTISAEFAGVATPSSVGMPATYTFLFHNLGITVGEAIGLVSIIMLTDITYFGSLMIVAIAVEFLGGSSQFSLDMVAPVLGVIAGGAAVIVLLIKNFRRVYHFVSRQMAKFSWTASKRYSLARGTVHFLRATRTLKKMSWPKLVLLYFVTVGFWLPRYMVLIVVIDLVGAHIGFAYLLLVQGVLNLGGQMIVIPAGGGVVDSAFAGFLSPYLSAEPLAFTLLVWRTFTFYFYLIIGGPIFLYETGHAAQNLLSQE